jgi:hypothetical protein
MLADSAWLGWPVIGWLITCRHLRAVRVKLQVPVRLRSGQALPYATPDFLSRKSGSAPVAMTKFRAVAHLDIGGCGWTGSKESLGLSAIFEAFVA